MLDAPSRRRCRETVTRGRDAPNGCGRSGRGRGGEARPVPRRAPRLASGRGAGGRRGGALVDGRPRPKSHRLEGGERVELPRRPRSPPPRRRPTGRRCASSGRTSTSPSSTSRPASSSIRVPVGSQRHARRRARRVWSRAARPRRPGIVHRLDRDTSGLMVVARSEEAHKTALRARSPPCARAHLPGARPRAPASRTGRIEAPIGRDRADPTRFSLDTDTPRDAITHFEVVELRGEDALLRVALETGPHPPDPCSPRGDRPARRRRPCLRRARACARAAVPARRAARVPAPVHRRAIDVDSPLPPELAAYWDSLG